MSAADLAGILPDLLPKLWVFALRLARDQRDAEELAQRACARALERTHQMKPGTSPLNWLFAILHAAWINDARRRRARHHTSDGWDVSFMETNEDPAGRNAEFDLMNRQIVMAVEKLPEAQRGGDAARGRRGLSYYEAARVLDVPVGTVSEPSVACAAHRGSPLCRAGRDIREGERCDRCQWWCEPCHRRMDPPPGERRLSAASLTVRLTRRVRGTSSGCACRGRSGPRPDLRSRWPCLRCR